jgi:hypothetical protein
MSDEETEQQLLFEVLLEMWDSQKLVEYFRKEYKRGFDAGVVSSSSSKDELERSYQSGRQSVLDDVRKMFPQHVAAVGDLKQPLAKSIVEVPSEPETDPPKYQQLNSHASKGVGRGPKPTNIDRPEGIPSNYEMCRMVLIDAGIPLTATEIRDRVAKRWWPSVPGDWKSSQFGFLGSGKLLKNADGKFILPEVVPEKRVTPEKPNPHEVINREVARRDSIAVKPAIPPARREVVTPGAKLGPPARGEGVAFQHGDKTVVLHQRERDIAVRLRTAMGVGHLDAKFLAGLIGIKSDAEATMRDFVAIMNPKLEAIGLKVIFYKGFGFAMAEI